jgi:hypothetical protein
MKSEQHVGRGSDEAHANLCLVLPRSFRVFGARDEETGILFH